MEPLTARQCRQRSDRTFRQLTARSRQPGVDALSECAQTRIVFQHELPKLALLTAEGTKLLGLATDTDLERLARGATRLLSGNDARECLLGNRELPAIAHNYGAAKTALESGHPRARRADRHAADGRDVARVEHPGDLGFAG